MFLSLKSKLHCPSGNYNSVMNMLIRPLEKGIKHKHFGVSLNFHNYQWI